MDGIDTKRRNRGYLNIAMKSSLIKLILFLSAQPVASTYFKNNGDANCSYPVSVTVDQVTCGANDSDNSAGSEYCTFGDTMFIAGEMTLQETLPTSEMCATTKVCFLGVSFLCRTYKETLDFCNAVGVSNEADGTACPNAGTFYFGTSLKVPGRSYLNLGSGWNVELKVLLEDCNAYKNYAFQCSTSFSAVSSQEATAGSAMMISGAALLGAAALVLFVSRKRRAAVLDLNQSEQSGFEMMSDSGVRA